MDLTGEAGKHVAEGLNTFLVAHLGPAGAALIWTLVWVMGAALALIFARYVGVLGAGDAAEGSLERRAYDNLRSSLQEGGVPTRVYGQLLTAFLNRVDRLFGDDDKADLSLFPHFFGMRGAYPLWTAAAFDRCLLLSLLYPIVSIFVIWAISGHVGPAEASLRLARGTVWWQRGVLVGGLATSLYFWWQAGKSSGWWSVLWCVAAAITGGVAGAGAGAGAEAGVVGIGVGVAGASAVAGAVIVAVAVAFAVGVAVAVAGAGAGAAGLFVAVDLLVIVAVSILSDLSASRRWQGALLAAFSCLMVVIVGFLAFDLSSSPAWDAAGPMLLFFGLLTLLNAPFDWLSLGLTRALLRRGVELGGWWPYGLAVLDAALALLILVMLAGAMVIGVQTFDFAATLGGGPPILPFNRLLDDIAQSPGDPVHWWIYALLLTTLIPSLANLLIGAVSLTRGVPGLSSVLLRFIPVGAAVPTFERAWIAAVLTSQWVIGVALTLGALGGLGFLVAWVVPEIGTLFLEYGRAIANLDLPHQAWTIVRG